MSIIINQREMSQIVYLAESAGRRALKDLSPAERKVVATVAEAWKKGEKQVKVEKLPGEGLLRLTTALAIAKSRRLEGKEETRASSGRVAQIIKGLGNIFGLRISSSKLEREIDEASHNNIDLGLTDEEIAGKITELKEKIKIADDLEKLNNDFSIRVYKEMSDFVATLPDDQKAAQNQLADQAQKIRQEMAELNTDDPQKEDKIKIYKKILENLEKLAKFEESTWERTCNNLAKSWDPNKDMSADVKKGMPQSSVALHREMSRQIGLKEFFEELTGLETTAKGKIAAKSDEIETLIQRLQKSNDPDKENKIAYLKRAKSSLKTVEDFQPTKWKPQLDTARDAWQRSAQNVASHDIESTNRAISQAEIQWLLKQKSQRERARLADSFETTFVLNRTKAILDWLKKPSATLDTSEQLKQIQQEMDGIIAASTDPDIRTISRSIGTPRKSRLNEYYNSMEREFERATNALDPLAADRYRLLNHFRTHFEAINAESVGDNRIALAEKWRADLERIVTSAQLEYQQTFTKPALEQIVRWWMGAETANKSEITDKQRATEDQMDGIILEFIKILKLMPNQAELAKKLSETLEMRNPDERYKQLEKLLVDHPLVLSKMRLFDTFRTQLRELSTMDYDKKKDFIPRTQELWASKRRSLGA